MNKTMNPRASKSGGNARRIAGLGCAAVVAVAPFQASAEVSDADFKALQEAVKQLSEKVQKLEQTHVADQQTHQQDADQIKQLQEKLGETQKAVAAAQSRADTAPAAPAGDGLATRLSATDTGVVNREFMVLGDAEVQYAKTSGSAARNATPPLNGGAFMMADFAPIFLYRGNDNVLFEAGFDFILQNNAPASAGATTTVNLSFATIDYVINDYATLVAGNMLLPLGTYSERGAGWLNKLPDTPLGRDLLPGAGVGAQLRGAIPLGDRGPSLTYAVWGVNGPGSADGTGNAGSLDLGGNVGLRSDNAVANLTGNPSGGARLGVFLPYKPHYDLEIGVSGQSGQWDPYRNHMWTGGVLDASLHLGPSIEIKGEYMRAGYGSDDMGYIRQEGYWVQAGYKLAGLNLDFPVLHNIELIGRYDAENTGMSTVTHRTSVGYVYYLTNALLFEGDYEFIHSTDPAQQGNQFILQLSYGF